MAFQAALRPKGLMPKIGATKCAWCGLWELSWWNVKRGTWEARSCGGSGSGSEWMMRRRRERVTLT